MSEPILEENVPVPDAPRRRGRPPLNAPETSEDNIKTFTPEPGTRLIVKSLIPELYRTIRSIPADTPYDQLGSAMQSAGWIWRLVERDTSSTPFGVYLVKFDVYIGKATADLNLELFDTISMSVPAEAPSPSLIARLNAQVALTYMIFNRLPPQAAPAPAPAPQPQPQQEARPAPEPEPEWMKPGKKAVELSATRTRDGVILIEDPYNVDAGADEIVDALFDKLERALEDINDAGLVNVLWSKNAQSVEFIKDFGGDAGRKRLGDIFRARSTFLNRS